VSVPWWPTSIRLATIARFIDAIVVVSAVLLFSIVVAALTDIVPSWSTLAFTMLGLGVAFTLLYGWLCRFIMRDTLGRRLAQLTASDNSDEIPSTACDAS
jgi:protein-S-isoprenylcysteine O-methyltransferase Ste14